jgi:hypothetical protein
MIINEAGRDHEAVGLNGTGRRVPEFAHRDNFAVGDCDIAAEGRHARAIDHTTMFDDQIIGHYQSSLQVPQPKAL